MAREFPASTNRLEASYQEAATRAKLNDWDAVIHLLQDTNSVFKTIARTNMANPLVFQGYLLLSEAQLARKEYSGALMTLDPFKKSLLNPTNQWQWQYQVCRIHLASGNLEEALQSATNLVMLASGPILQAESFAFEADLLERLGRLDQAINAYTNNLVDAIPLARQREALVKVTELSITRNRVAEAAQTIERFLSQNPKSPAADLALVGLGELRLRQYYENSDAAKRQAELPGPSADTNLLSKAKGALLTVVTNFPQSLALGKSHMDLGWCFLFELNPVESEKQFFLALEKLPRSADRALTHFKLGDLQFKRGNFAGALTNYSAVLQEGGSEPLIETVRGRGYAVRAN